MIGKIESSPTLRVIFSVVIASPIVLFLSLLLWASFTSFTWGNFQLMDYGMYANTIWNCGHGHFFRYLVDLNYLGTHMSLTLALLGPLLWIWDHPFLLLDLITWDFFDSDRHRPDLVFVRFRGARGGYLENCKANLQSGEFGVRYWDDVCAILERGYSTIRNEELLKGFFNDG